MRHLFDCASAHWRRLRHFSVVLRGKFFVALYLDGGEHLILVSFAYAFVPTPVLAASVVRWHLNILQRLIAKQKV